MAYSTEISDIISRAAGYETNWAAAYSGYTQEQREISLALMMHPKTLLTSAAVVLTAAYAVTAADNGKTFYINHATGFAITLPTAVLGMRYTFILKTGPTSGDHTVTAATADTIVGWPSNIGGADSVADGNALGDVLNFKVTASLPGDRAEFFSDGSFWYVRAHAKAINAITITG
jgi:hypothetical protein